MLSSEVISMEQYEPSDQQIEAAARAYLGWQFPGRTWETAIEGMKAKFREGARIALRAAYDVPERQHRN